MLLCNVQILHIITLPEQHPLHNRIFVFFGLSVVGEEFAELRDDEGGGGAGTEDHAGFDVVDGLVGGEFFEVVLGESWGRWGGSGEGDEGGRGGCVGSERGGGRLTVER
uniref:Uncharacterized protein n=1 Tax=Daucus carota subsp. sativus TaxID=79200 RepID=A0A162A6J4_DAUCS